MKAFWPSLVSALSRPLGHEVGVRGWQQCPSRPRGKTGIVMAMAGRPVDQPTQNLSSKHLGWPVKPVKALPPEGSGEGLTRRGLVKGNASRCV